jgi:hypothetical protein
MSILACLETAELFTESRLVGTQPLDAIARGHPHLAKFIDRGPETLCETQTFGSKGKYLKRCSIMKMTRQIVALAAFVIGVLASAQTQAFTSQLPVSGYRFLGPLNLVENEVGALDSLYTVPAGRIAVITDVYVTLSSGATGTHTTIISNSSLQTKAGPFKITATSPFSKGYTSGIVFIAGQQILVSDTGGTGDATINLVGYEVCAEPCNNPGPPDIILPPDLITPILPPGFILPPDIILPPGVFPVLPLSP